MDPSKPILSNKMTTLLKKKPTDGTMPKTITTVTKEKKLIGTTSVTDPSTMKQSTVSVRLVSPLVRKEIVRFKYTRVLIVITIVVAVLLGMKIGSVLAKKEVDNSKLNTITTIEIRNNSSLTQTTGVIALLDKLLISSDEAFMVAVTDEVKGVILTGETELVVTDQQGVAKLYTDKDALNGVNIIIKGLDGNSVDILRASMQSTLDNFEEKVYNEMEDESNSGTKDEYIILKGVKSRTNGKPTGQFEAKIRSEKSTRAVFNKYGKENTIQKENTLKRYTIELNYAIIPLN